VRIYEWMAIFIIYRVSYLSVTFLKVICASAEVYNNLLFNVCFKHINFSIQIFSLFVSELCISFTSRIVQSIANNFVSILQLLKLILFL
jgi:hypothetical protein